MKLKDKSDLTISKKGKILLIHAINVFSLIQDLSGRWSIERAQDVKKGRLPYAGGPDNGSLLPPRKSEVDSLQNLHAFCSVSVGLEKLLDLDQFFQTIASLAF
jgi:hypothetical protein